MKPGPLLLEALRDQGLGRTVEERLALARVSQRFEGTTADYANAVGALLGRSRDEVHQIRELVLLHAGGQATGDSLAPSPPTPPRSLLSLAWPVLLAAAFIALGFATPLVVRAWAEKPTRPPPVPPPVTSLVIPETPATQRACEPAHVPAGTTERVPNPDALGAAAAVLALLVAAAALRTARLGRLSRNNRVRAKASEWPGPADYSVRRSKPAALLTDSDRARVERELRRATGTTRMTAELDVPASVEATLQAGMFPTAVFHEEVRPGSLLVLIEQSADNQLWTDRLEWLLSALKATASCDFRFLDVKAGLVIGADGRAIPLRKLARSEIARAVLLIAERSALVDARGAVLPSVTYLLQWPRHAWLDPLAKRVRGTSDRRLPRCFPGTATGVLRAAAFLAEGAVPRSLSVPYETPLAGSSLAARFEFVTTIVGGDLELAKETYRRVFNDDPESALRLLLGTNHAPLDRQPRRRLEALFLKLERTGATEGFDDTRALEGRCRVVLLEVLRQSEPEPGSLAHLRWSRDVALYESLATDPEVRRAGIKQLAAIAERLPPEELPTPSMLGRWGFAAPLWTHAGLEERLARADLTSRIRGAKSSALGAGVRLPSLRASLLILGVAATAIASLGMKAYREQSPPVRSDICHLEFEAERRRLVISCEPTDFSAPRLFKDVHPRVQMELAMTWPALEPAQRARWSTTVADDVSGCLYAEATGPNGQLARSNALSVPKRTRELLAVGVLQLLCDDTSDQRQRRLIARLLAIGQTVFVTCSEVTLQVGAYDLLDDGGQRMQSFQIKPGETTTVDLRRPSDEADMGTLIVRVTVRSPPFDRPVRVNRYDVNGDDGSSKLGEVGKPVQLKAGAYGVVLNDDNDELVPTTFRISVTAGKTTDQTVVARTKDGMVMVGIAGLWPGPVAKTGPGDMLGGNVLFIDGAAARSERSGGFRLSPGTYNLRLERVTLNPNPVTVRSGETTVVSASVTPPTPVPVPFEQAMLERLSNDCPDTICGGDFSIDYTGLVCQGDICTLSFTGTPHSSEVVAGSGTCTISRTNLEQDFRGWVYPCMNDVTSTWSTDGPPKGAPKPTDAKPTPKR